MAWVLDHAALTAAREEAKAEAEQFPDSLAFQRLGRAHLWLDEEAEARRRFREAADDMRAEVIDAGRADHASTWAQYGHLLRLAGDADGARAAFERALAMERQDETRAMELRYLLGQDPGRGGDGVIAQTLGALAARDPVAIEAARETLVLALRAGQTAPDSTAGDLTLYDLLEETFRVEAQIGGRPVPDHRTMLERTALLQAAPPPAAPAIEPPPVGRWTVGAASIEQGDEGPIVVTIDGDLWLELIQSFGEYEVRTWRGQMQVNTTGMHATFGEAIEAAADSLRAEAGEPAVATLTALVAEYGQPH